MSKIQTPQAVRGTQDMFGEAQERFEHVVTTFERVRRLYGFKGLQMPVIEPTAVFSRSLGEATDVVSKEMYTFDDRGGDSITLRPEFTAGIARAFLTNGWQQYAPMKLSTHGPLFRYERPQKGRYRQFHQIDAEIIGAAEPAADVELLVMADQLLKELGINDGVTLQLNTLGDTQSRDAWRAALVEYFDAHFQVLSFDSMQRMKNNPLRILDSKSPEDQEIVKHAPTIDQFHSSEAQDFFGAVTAGLDAAGVAWTRNAQLVRGLDYYRHTAFEFITDRLGAQGTVLGGGRYDGLIENLGGKATPAVGWAAGIERLAMLVGEGNERDFTIAVVPNGEMVEANATRISQLLRSSGMRCVTAFRGNLKKRSEALKKQGVDAVFIIRNQDDPMGWHHLSHIEGSHDKALQKEIEQKVKDALKGEFGSQFSFSGWNRE
jgi:histidyl-tRNA synthetase